MNQTEFDKTLPTIPRAEQRAFQSWYMQFQELVSWDTFKDQGFKHVAQVVQVVQDHVEEKTGEPEQLKLAFMPRELARTSPFFPMSKKEMKERPESQKNIPLESRWGRITVSGPKLAIYDESLLLALLLLAKDHSSNSFQTSYGELCRLMKVSRGKNQYAAISKSLDRLTSAKVKTELFGEKKKETTATIQGTMISNAYQEEKSGKLIIEINRYFLTLYGKNLTVSLDIDKRAALKGDVTKALYRFLETHKATPKPVPYGLMTLATAVNMNVERPLFEIRKQMRAALRELRQHGHVKSWEIKKSDNVIIRR